MDFGGGMGGVNGNANVDLMQWYMKIPPVSRVYLTTAFLTTAACAVDLVSPLTLYYSFELVFQKGQLWRLVTPYLFFGVFSVDFLFHMYFLVQYSRLLEEGDFRDRTANYVWMLLFGVVNISFFASYDKSLLFLGNALTLMMTYVWGRRNEDVKMVFLGFLHFNAPYLPWVVLTFSALLGHSIKMDLIGIVVGHAYYFLAFVYPAMAEIRGWEIKRVMDAPFVLQWLCGNHEHDLPLQPPPVANVDDTHLHEE